MSALIDAALAHLRRGFAVLPLWWRDPASPTGCACRDPKCASPAKHPIAALVPHGGKDASKHDETVVRWFETCPQANLGIATGLVSGFDVLDVDGDDGRASLDAYEREHGPLPATVEAITGGGGRHILFAHVGGLKNAVRFAPGLDVRTDGGYIVAEPSVHASGRPYAWEVGHHPDESPLAPWPLALVALVTASRARARAAEPSDARVVEGGRNAYLASVAGTLRRAGLDEAAIVAALLVENQTKCSPPLADDEVRGIARSIAQYPAGDSNTEKRSIASRLIDLARAQAKLFHDPAAVAYADVRVSGHRETLRLRSNAFRSWLERLFYETERRAAGSQAMTDALGALEGLARYDGEERAVFVRAARTPDALYIDLGRDDWSAVEVTRDGWRVVGEPPVRFRRARGMRPLPLPADGGSVDALRPFVNLLDDRDFRLAVAWVLAALCGRHPYPILVLQGEQGSGKSTTARVLRALIDPATVPLRSPPREERDLAVAAGNGHVVGFDNLSGLAPWLADAMCRLATGGGFGTRQLYTDDEEALFAGARPVLLNGIDDLMTRPDLADRAIVLTLPTIADTERKPEAEFERDLAAALPGTFGAFLTAVAASLRNRADVQLARLPRMADFAVTVAAAESALGWPAGTFLDDYRANREGAVEASLDADPLADAILTLFADATRLVWAGSATDLLVGLNRQADEMAKRTPSWPKAPHALSNRLKRLAPGLRAVGINVRFSRDGKSRGISLERMGDESVTSVTSDAVPGPSAASRDGGDACDASSQNSSSAASADTAVDTPSAGADLWRCRACASPESWLSTCGERVCRICHPPAPGAEVAS